jgi:hypothetical protein
MTECSCNRKSIDYKEKLCGIWQISNAADILKVKDYPGLNSEDISKGTISFTKNGKLLTNIGKLQHKGKWSVSEDGTALKIKADSIRFDENIPIAFENERTIVINNAGIKFVMSKIQDCN